MKQEEFEEFREFMEASGRSPSPALTEKIDHWVERKLNPPHWSISLKFFLIQSLTGILTLAVCPQFDVGFGGHYEWLHQLHLMTTPFVFFLICGMIFVSLGASLAGLLFTRDEIRVMIRSRYLLFVGYSLLSYLTFQLLGSDALFLNAFAWISGAIVGNVVGFNAVEKIRFVAS